MIFYKTDTDRLIQYNPETKVYKYRDNIERIDTRISEEDFKLLNIVKIKKQKFVELMNIFFKNIKHSWEYQGEKFRKLDNFEQENYSLSSNYVLGKEVPYHNFENNYPGRYILVYHWGKPYFHTISYGGGSQGQLCDLATRKSLQWCALKNCAPIFNTTQKKII